MTRCLTSLAVGTDQIFAEEALHLDLELEAVVPFADYERCFDADHLAEYRHLRDRCTRVTILRPQASDQASFLAAGIYIADACNLLIAVWDGERAAALGGTADVVRHALETKRDVIHLNPLSRTYRELAG